MTRLLFVARPSAPEVLMPAVRCLLSALAASLALAALTHAAPAPFRRAEATHPEVSLRRQLPYSQRSRAHPSVIVRQSDWEAAARAWGIEDPPKVDFRTHFLAAHVSP